MGGFMGSEDWKNNIMYRVVINRSEKAKNTSLYVEFAQTDGRLLSDKDNGFPYSSTQASFMICWLKMKPDQNTLEGQVFQLILSFK